MKKSYYLLVVLTYLQTSISGQTDLKMSYTQQLVNAQNNLTKLQKELDGLKVTSTTLQQQIDSKTTEAANAQAITTKNPPLILKLTNDLEILKKQRGMNPVLITQQQAQLTKLNNELTKAKTNLPKLNLELATLKEQKANNNNAIQQKESALQRKNAEITQIQDIIRQTEVFTYNKPENSDVSVVASKNESYGMTIIPDTVVTGTSKKTDTVLTPTLFTVATVMANPNPAYDLTISPTVVAAIQDANPNLNDASWTIYPSQNPSPKDINKFITSVNDLNNALTKVENLLSNASKQNALYALITSGAPYYMALINYYFSDRVAFTMIFPRVKDGNAVHTRYQTLLKQIQTLP